MDTQKDTQGQTAEVTVNGSIVPEKSVSKGQPISHIFLVQKGNKVSIASYLITDHLPSGDPIRERIRTCAVEFIKDSHAMLGSSKLTEKLPSLTALAMELLSLFEIAFLSRMVSEGNHALMKRELSALKQGLEAAFSLEGKPIVPDDFFKVDALLEKKGIERLNVNPAYKGHKSVLYGSVSNDVLKKEKLQNSLPVEPVSSQRSGNKGERRETILKLIRKDKSVSIKDIYSFFSDVGEKTIQRELSRMVEDGLIIRTGDKRWSRYSLK